MGCAPSASTYPSLKNKNKNGSSEVYASKAAKVTLRAATIALLAWRASFVSLVDALDGACCAGALWAEEEKDIPFSKAFKNLSLTAIELSVASTAFLEAIDNHSSLLANILSLQRDHHDSIKRLAAQIIIFQSISAKLDLSKSRDFKSSTNTINLTASRTIAKNSRRKRRNHVDPEEIITGCDALDLAPQKHARTLLDQLIKLEHHKRLDLVSFRDDKLVDSIHSVFLAQGSLWTRFSQIFDKMKRVCYQYNKFVAQAVGSGAALKLALMGVQIDSSTSRTMATRRRSVSNTADLAFASKQQKMLSFQNPETNARVCKNRLKLIKRWHYLAEISCKLWLELRDAEIAYVNKSIEWLNLEGDSHSIVQQMSCYAFDDGTAMPNIECRQQQKYMAMYSSWAQAIKRSAHSKTKSTAVNGLNLEKPIAVVHSCLQYLERTLFNVNEREKSALDLVRKLDSMNIKQSFFGRPSAKPPRAANKSAPTDRRVSVMSGGQEQITGGNSNTSNNHRHDLLKHKLDKTLMDNRIFRRTKLMKSHAELCRGFESCTKFIGTLYIYLGTEHDPKVSLKLLVPYSDEVLSIVSDKSKSKRLDAKTNALESFDRPKEISGTCNTELFQTSQAENRTEKEEVFETIENIQINPERRRTLTDKLTNILSKSLQKIYPEIPENSEFCGLSKQDESALQSQTNLMLVQISRSTRGSVNLDPDVFKLSLLNTQKSHAQAAVNDSNVDAFVDNNLQKFVSRSVQTSVEIIENLSVPAKLIPNENYHDQQVNPKIVCENCTTGLHSSATNDTSAITKENSSSANLLKSVQEIALLTANVPSPENILTIPTNENLESPNKIRKKKKRVPSSSPATPVPKQDNVSPLPLPSAPPRELMAPVQEAAATTAPSNTKSHRKKKKHKAPPPPPPLNPEFVSVSQINFTPVAEVVSATPPLLTFSPVSPPSESVIGITVLRNSSEIENEDAVSRPTTLNILENELKALAPRAISPDSGEVEIHQTPTSSTLIDASDVLKKAKRSSNKPPPPPPPIILPEPPSYAVSQLDRHEPSYTFSPTIPGRGQLASMRSMSRESLITRGSSLQSQSTTPGRQLDPTPPQTAIPLSDNGSPIQRSIRSHSASNVLRAIPPSPLSSSSRNLPPPTPPHLPQQQLSPPHPTNSDQNASALTQPEYFRIPKATDTTMLYSASILDRRSSSFENASTSSFASTRSQLLMGTEDASRSGASYVLQTRKKQGPDMARLAVQEANGRRRSSALFGGGGGVPVSLSQRSLRKNRDSLIP
ncbi:hypothetical protein HK100_010441 [Physocladia obscura]|uniref:Uncharacterized protein n=1 Tax=Physocladia obscura TaxID=109957 RepID=A0AAD5T378_9FUNG|nr:hypothetical protein HK100_010441 [Physocladia obscura]